MTAQLEFVASSPPFIRIAACGLQNPGGTVSRLKIAALSTAGGPDSPPGILAWVGTPLHSVNPSTPSCYRATHYLALCCAAASMHIKLSGMSGYRLDKVSGS